MRAGEIDMSAEGTTAARIAFSNRYPRVTELSSADKVLLREWLGQPMGPKDLQRFLDRPDLDLFYRLEMEQPADRVNLIRSLRYCENAMVQTRLLLNEARGKLNAISSILCSRIGTARNCHEGMVLLSMAVEIAEVLQRGRAELRPRPLRVEVNQ